MTYTTRYLCTVFGITHQTAKTWSKTFADALSPTARPESGKPRVFTDEDLRVFDLVKTMRADRKTFEEIKFALSTGQRGGIPEAPIELAPSQQSAALIAAMNRVRELEAEVKTQTDRAVGAEANNKLLRELLKEAQDEVVQLKLDLKWR